MKIVAVLFSLVSVSTACDYYQTLEPYKFYDIFSPNFNGQYNPNTSCRWVAVAPTAFTIHLDCVLVELPSSPKCMEDHIMVSETGRLDLQDGRRYCGRGAFDFTTPTNILVVGMKSGGVTKGGRFFCTMKAIEDGCECGRRDRTRIVGGTKAKTNEFPMMAGLVDTTAMDKVYCGATLISSRHLLTAGHCIVGRKLRNLAVLVGDDNTTVVADTPYAAVYRIAQVVMHPEFASNGAVNDVAIVKTFETIQFNEGVNVACLPFKFAMNEFTNTVVVVPGWGTIEFSGPKSDKLMKVRLNVISNQKCSDRGMDVNMTHICTYTPGKDSCQYDSGGPLLHEDTAEDRLYVIGIVSRGNFCASKFPSVNTRVTKYLDWIVRSTPEVNYCKK